MDLRELPQNAFARHPWEIVRADFFARLLREHVRGNGLSALDMGAGDGFFAGRLLGQVSSIARITCFDLAYSEAWLRDKAAGPTALSFTAVRPTSNFDLVVLLDVIEHVADDLAGSSAAHPPIPRSFLGTTYSSATSGGTRRRDCARSRARQGWRSLRKVSSSPV
jgi:hypothetical protein